jgi:hypothetical protein
MDVRWFIVREAQQEREIDVNFIETEFQLAEIFIKALPVTSSEMSSLG